MTVKIGMAEGTCPKCGKTLRRRRPADFAVCNCYEHCPNCSPAYTVKMNPYAPDLTPTNYGPIESETAIGDMDRPMKILYKCPICGYLSSQLPVEVLLS